MCQLYKDKVDIHTYTTENIFEHHKDLTDKKLKKEQRRIGKTCNFHFVYGGGVATFQNILLKEIELWFDEDELVE